MSGLLDPSPTPQPIPRSICFATMCKNEEHCIRETLEAVAPYITSWVVCDTGSTDRTCEIVTGFFFDRGIPGQLYKDEWVGFDVNKTLMMERARISGAEYTLHLDADDWFVPTRPGWDLTVVDKLKADCYYATLRRGTDEWKATILYSNQLTWRFCGVAHTIIKCENPQPLHGELLECYVDAEARGARAFDPNKYQGDADKLIAQFDRTITSDPDGLHARSAFYAAQSYMDCHKFDSAIEWYLRFLTLPGTWIEERFEAYLRIARCSMALKYSIEAVVSEIQRAIEIEPDRAEPLYWLGLYCNQRGEHGLAYEYLTRARKMDLAAVRTKYLLFINPRCYGTYVHDELSVACFWTDRCDEGIALATAIVDDPRFAEERGRIAHNLELLAGRKQTLTGSTGLRSGPMDVFTLRDTHTSPQVIVVDDFYADPAAVRALALGCEFAASPDYHKGLRTVGTYRPDHVRQAFERVIGKPITRWEEGINGVFQFCTAKEPLVYHHDTQQYAGVVYLTPEAPYEAGTSFYRHKGSGRRRAPVDFTGGFYDRTQFELVDAIGNVYNRLVLWDAQLIHAASAYFGQKLEDARLFQIFFFDVG